MTDAQDTQQLDADTTTIQKGGGLEDLAEDLNALASLQRLRLLHFLTRPRYGEEIAEVLGVTRQAAMKHIDKLEERGFVRALNGWRETGPVREYQVVPQRLFAMGVTLGDLGKLEPEGGPDVRRADRTVAMPDALTAERDGATAEPRAPHLLVVNGPSGGERLPLEGEGPRWTIGRGEDRDIRLTHDPYVSSRHAEVQVDMRGHAIVDVYSANGTFLNYSRLPKGGRVPLNVGDLIAVGHTFLIYQRE